MLLDRCVPNSAALFTGAVLCLVLWNDNARKGPKATPLKDEAASTTTAAAATTPPAEETTEAGEDGSTLRGALNIIATNEDVVLVGLPVKS